MKRLFILMVLLMPLALPVGVTGCKTATTTSPATLAPGYADAADQAMGETLVGAHAFYVTIQADVAAGKYTPSAMETTALNDLGTALNAAQIIYIGYHAGVNTQAQAQTAVNAVSTQQTALQTTVTAGVK